MLDTVRAISNERACGAAAKNVTAELAAMEPDNAMLVNTIRSKLLHGMQGDWALKRLHERQWHASFLG